MKGRIAILLMFALLMTATQAHQLVKLPFFISHYLHYSQDHHAGGFLAFVHDHYVDSPSNSTDGHDDHDKLPFHSADGISVSKLPLSPPIEESNGHVISEETTVNYAEPVRELRAQPVIEITVPPPQVKPKPELKPRPCKCKANMGRGSKSSDLIRKK